MYNPSTNEVFMHVGHAYLARWGHTLIASLHSATININPDTKILNVFRFRMSHVGRRRLGSSRMRRA